MAIQGVDTKCYILALFIRDDDERFLLGSGQFEFKDTQKQFEANAIQNDVVEVQGNDGYLLAGQVRRSGTQNFDGYVGDGTMAKTEVEENRRKFFAFYQKNHFYRVVYVFPDGTAIQRKRGFLVDDPTVQELYQQYPEYHVALNFEDVNYYSYSENEQGEEEYAKEAIIELSTLRATGGLIWDEYGAVSDGFTWGGETTVTGTEFQIQNELDLPAPVTDAKIYGDTEQQTYSGKNLLNVPDGTFSQNGITWTRSGNIANGSGVSTSTYCDLYNDTTCSFPAGTYTLTIQNPISQRITLYLREANNTRHSYNINAGSTFVTFTTNYDAVKQHVTLGGFSSGDTIDVSLALQLENGSTATAFEPYVGGVPAPNPDYPQDIHVVTGEQTVANVGKNLVKFTADNLKQNSGSVSTTTMTFGDNYVDFVTNTNVTAVQYAYYYSPELKTENTYTISFDIDKIQNYTNNRFTYSYSEDGTTWSSNYNVDISLDTGESESIKRSFTGHKYIRFGFYNCTSSGASAGTHTIFKNVQLEVGASATDFEPHQSQTWVLDLGTTELCKLGNYQDYIYKSGSDWYVHKEIGKVVFDGTESWTGQNSNNYFTSDVADALIITNAGVLSPIISTTYSSATPSNIYSGSIDYGISLNSGTARIRVRNKDCANSTAMKAWFSSNNTTAYYALATPTDTQITDTDLIDALNALDATKLFIGENNISVTPTGSNLPAELQLKYYTSVDHTGSGYIWEEGGSGGPTIIDNASITNVYPIWTVYGPAVNPTLSVITTNTTLSYTGTVAAYQTLVIDMMNKTAKLNGTSVIGNVSGDWVNFAPGINRIIYDTDNSDTPPSLAQWQEVVG